MCLPFHKRVELKDKERFPGSKPAREKPFRMYNDSKVITVKLTNLEEGWKFDKTNDTQVNCNFYFKKLSIKTHRWQVPLF